MEAFKIKIDKFGDNGEKTGWTYVLIPASEATKINPGVKKSYRVKGYLDKYPIKGIAIMPDGEGNFIMPLNAVIRKGIKKTEGDVLQLSIELDTDPLPIDEDFIMCLHDDSRAKAFYDTLSPSHQSYFYKWVASAKTYDTKANRIALCLESLAQKMSYGEMIRANKKKNE